MLLSEAKQILKENGFTYRDIDSDTQVKLNDIGEDLYKSLDQMTALTKRFINAKNDYNNGLKSEEFLEDLLAFGEAGIDDLIANLEEIKEKL